MYNVYFILILILLLIKIFVSNNNENFQKTSCNITDLNLSENDFTYNYDKINNIFNIPNNIMETNYYANTKKNISKKPNYIDKYAFCTGRFSKISGLC